MASTTKGLIVISSNNEEEQVNIQEHQHGTAKSEPFFDQLLDRVGGTGTFQIILYVVVNIAFEFPAACAATYFIIEGANPGWKCTECLGFTNETNPCTSFGNETVGSCNIIDKCSNFTFNKQFTSIVTEWSLICDEEWVGKMVASIFFLGMLVGVNVMGFVSDKFGRKMSLIPSWLLQAISQSLLSVAPSVAIYSLLRFTAGFFNGCLAANGAILAMEYIPPKWRTIVGFRFGWQIGTMVTALLAFLIPNWRHLALATGLISLPILPFVAYFMPESARWHFEKRNLDETEKCIKLVARINGQEVDDLRGIIKSAMDAEIRVSANKRKSLNCTYMFRTKKMALRSVVLIYAWLATSLVFYGISNQMSGMTGNMYLNIFISAVGVALTRWIYIFIVNWLGRRLSLLLFLGIPGLFLMAILAMDLTGFLKNNASFVTYFGLAAYIIGSGAWCVTTFYSAELYPTLLRNVATGAGFMGARIGSIIAPQVSLMGSLHRSAPYVVFAGISLTAAVIGFIVLPETTNKPLPEDTEDDEEDEEEEEMEDTSIVR